MKDITAMPTMFLDVCILDFSQSENETLGTSEWDLRDLSQDKYRVYRCKSLRGRET